MEAAGPDDLLRRAEALEAEAVALRARMAESAAAEDGRRARTQHPWAALDGATHVALIATDPAGHVTDWNAGAHTVLGWTADAMRGRPVAELYTPEDQTEGRPGRTMRTALDQGRAEEAGWRLCADGARRWVSGETVPLRDTSGAPAGFVTILRDRTDLQQVERALRASEERYRTLFESTGRTAR